MNHKILTIHDLYSLFRRRFWVIVAAMCVVTMATACINLFVCPPTYQSTAILYILRQDDEPVSSDDATNDFSLALKVVNDCHYLLKSRPVLDAVIAACDLDMDHTTLYESITVHNPTDTRILEVTVEAETPEKAKLLVDTLCDIGQKRIADAMGSQQVSLYAYGILSDQPSNRISWPVYLVIAAGTAVVLYALFMIRLMLDNRLRTEHDIVSSLQLPVLGQVPAGKEAAPCKRSI